MYVTDGRDPLAVRAATTPGQGAVRDTDRDRHWTYGELSEWADRLVADLPQSEGRIGILVADKPAVAATAFAVMRAGQSAVLLDPREPPDRLSALAERADVQTLVCDGETVTTGLECDCSQVYCTEESDRAPAEHIGDGELEVVERFDPGSEAVVAFTSGSGGEPKGVRLTGQNLLASATASAYRLGVDPADRWLDCLPTHHMGGFAPIVRTTLYGCPLVTQRSFDATETARVIRSETVTVVSLVPTMLHRLLEAGWTVPDHLRVVLLGGAPASRELLEAALAADVPVHTTYGMTETASQITTATPEEVSSDPDSVGRPLFGTTVSIRGEEDEAGPIVVRGPTVMAGYLDEDRTDATFEGPWFRTGDRGRLDAENRLTVVGRLEDRIITGGETVDRTAIENALRALPIVEDAAVVGLSDPEWGERVAALIVPPSTEVAVTDLKEAMDDRLASHRQPKTIAVADEVPRTASGTIDRDAVRSLIEAAGVDRGNGQ